MQVGCAGEDVVDEDRAPGSGGRPEMYGLPDEARKMLMFCDEGRKGMPGRWRDSTRSGAQARRGAVWTRVVEMNASARK